MKTIIETEKQVDHSQSYDLSKIRLLVVEDDKITQFLNMKILLKMGFSVEVAGDSIQALEQLKINKFDVVLMDIRLPGMDGIEITRLIRNMDEPICSLPVFAITTSVAESEKQRAANAGVNEYFTKPYDTNELLEVILKYLKN